jgi:hypothetical protein
MPGAFGADREQIAYLFLNANFGPLILLTFLKAPNLGAPSVEGAPSASRLMLRDASTVGKCRLSMLLSMRRLYGRAFSQMISQLYKSDFPATRSVISCGM